MTNRLYEKIGYAYVLRELLSRALIAESEIGPADYAACQARASVTIYLERLVRQAIDLGIERGEFALPDFKLEALSEEFARAVYRITRIEAQQPPTFRDVVRAKWRVWKRRALER